MDTSKTIKKKVQERYGGIAINLGSAPAGQARPCSCAPNLYSAEEIAALPEDAANLALGCGNPTAIADLKPGQVVLDLGSGGGIDCFLAAKKVGPKGKVYGLDMTPAMIEQARKNAAKVGAKNVEFILGEIEKIPLPDASVNVIISNCVINLSPEKEKVFAEAFRVLRPGGEFCVSDMVLLDKMPDAIKLDPNSWSSCVSGALPKDEYLAKLKAVGFTNLEVKQSNFVDDKVSWLTSLYVKGKKAG